MNSTRLHINTDIWLRWTMALNSPRNEPYVGFTPGNITKITHLRQHFTFCSFFFSEQRKERWLPVLWKLADLKRPCPQLSKSRPWIPVDLSPIWLSTDLWELRVSPGISGIVGKLEKQSNSPKTKNRTALEKVVCSHLVNDLECHFS